VTLTIRDHIASHHCAEATAAAVIAAALRNGHAVTVEADDSPTRWRFTPTVRGVTIAAVNPSLFTDSDPPPWATRLAATAERLI